MRKWNGSSQNRHKRRRLLSSLGPKFGMLVLGIMAIVRGSKLMGSGAYGAGNSKAIPIMFIINIINCDAIGLVVGIVCLVFQAEPEVADYLDGVSEMEMEMDV